MLGGRKVQRKRKESKSRNTKKKRTYNNEINGIIFLAIGILTILSLFFEGSIGLFGLLIKKFMFGALGLPAFILPPSIILYGIISIFKSDIRLINRRYTFFLILLAILSAFFQTASYRAGDLPDTPFLQSLIDFAENGVGLTGGGVIGGLVSMPFLILFKPLGTIIILTALSIIDIILLTNISLAGFLKNLRSAFKGVVRSVSLKPENNEIYEDFPFNPDFLDDFEEPIKHSKNNVINFEIEKSLRHENPEDIIQLENDEDTKIISEIEHEKLIIEDIKRTGKRRKNIDKSYKTNIAVPQYQKTSEKYKFPPLSLLEYSASSSSRSKSIKTAAIEKAKKLEETLFSFGVDAKIINISRGPTVTRYELQPSSGVKVSRIVSLADDIALNLAAPAVRIEAPIPGKAAIGIEVPNDEITTVSLREVIESEEFKSSPSKLTFAMGKDISGQCIVTDLSRMPHLLIAGATGTGKSVCINSLIVSLIYKSSPDEVKLIMIDPKVVELGLFNGIPHLLIPVVTEPKKAAGALNWAVQEMTDRYKKFAEHGVRDIAGYNDLVKKGKAEEMLPQIVIIIDELADLMMVAPTDVEDAICRLAQMARAAGMHLIIATQRPSVNVITGVIKANVPSRISFAVSSQVDSRTILDTGGAEKLLGRGDMLFYPVGTPKPFRIQGSFVSEAELERVVEFLKSQGVVEYDNDIIEEINNEQESPENYDNDRDELLPAAIELVVDAGQASVSLIQRKFKVGYARAARIIDQMEERGIVGGFEGSKPRQVLITKMQWQEMKMKNEK
jgi:S-DNA-T family DNA segregation ATPase FtsK/SpoIIIE